MGSRGREEVVLGRGREEDRVSGLILPLLRVMVAPLDVLVEIDLGNEGERTT